MRRVARAVVVALLVLTAFAAGADLGADLERARALALAESPELVDLASVDARSCRRARRAVRVRVSRARWPHIARHIERARDRYPRVLHLDRRGADENREESLRGVATRPGFDRDEYPPAVAREGGAGADIGLVPSSENRSAGAVLGNRLRPFCDGQRFVFRVRR